MNWAWPQFTMLVLYVISLTISLAQHGKPQPARKFFLTAVCSAIGAWILHEGGFW